VGQAVRLPDRLRQHRRQPPIEWWRAVAVVRDTSNGFNSAEIGYLEGRLAAELRARPGIALRAGKIDIDETLPDHLLISLDALIPAILAGLRIAGAPLYTDEASGPTARGRRGRPRRIEGTVADLLAAGLLAAGARLVLTRAGKSVTAVVSASGSLLVDGVAYDSPSMAGKTALGRKTINGWTAWHLEERPDISLGELRAQLGTAPD